MITGYFQVKNGLPHLKKLVSTCLFYGWFTLVIFLILKSIGIFSDMPEMSIRTLIINAVSPSLNGVWWFVTAYFLLMLMTPTLNNYINRMDYKKLFKIIILMWIILIVLGMINETPYYGLYRGIFYYLIGALFRHCNQQNIEKNKIKKGIIAMCCAIFGWIFGAFMCYYSLKNGCYNKWYEWIFYFFACPMCSMGFFKMFEIFPIKQNFFVNQVAATTFGIYLLHDSVVARRLIWLDIFRIDAVFLDNIIFLFAAFGISLIVFISCSIIDMLRRYFFDAIILKYVNKVF